MSICRVVASGSILGQRCQNVMHFKNIDGALTHAQIVTEVNDFLLLRFRNLQNASWNWTDIAVQDNLDSTPDLLTVHAITGAGSLSGEPALTFAAGIFSIRTPMAGRHGHGRIYMPGVHGASVQSGVIQSGAFSAYQGAAANIKARFIVGSVGPLLLGVAPRAHPGDWVQANDLVVRPNFGVQRRRNIGVGG